MFKFLDAVANIFGFDTRNSEPIGLKGLRCVEAQVKQPVVKNTKKEYKLSELLKKELKA